ncbi:AMP-binding protein [uncultured Propionibacterium sp.]|uniref:AMP-binding protein n=1 Tax=uncultured Propionibacterium sp. TaxID=218066 RepID=UPI00292D4D2B|nr:AMP-binding protein [uncultured Propionibacterium sp.]
MINHLADLLLDKKNEHDLGLTLITPGDLEGEFHSYAELLGEAAAYRLALADAGVGQGDFVILQLTDNRAFVQAFWGCIWGGAVPVPLACATEAAALEQLNRIRGCLPGSRVLHQPSGEPGPPDLSELPGAIDMNALVPREPADEAEAAPAAVGPGALRLVQFSSGSTGEPKGVLITEANLIAGMAALVPERKSVLRNSMLSWLPLTHNLSLVGVHLYSMYRDYGQVLMPTSQFVMDPFSWLRAIDIHRPTVTFCPNFACKHTLAAIARRGTGGLEGLDLSSLAKVINGSEPVDTLVAMSFQETLAPYGLRENVMVPGYGLTEASLGVSVAEIYEPLRTVTLERSAILTGARIADLRREHGATFVGLGRAAKGIAVSIRDGGGRRLPDGTVGEIWISGEPIALRYLDAAGEHVRPLSEDGYLDTGDLGALIDGELYVVGRKKDIIFVNGKNYYSHDLERALEEGTGLDTAVVGLTDDSTGQEAIHLFFAGEPDPARQDEATGILMREFGVPVTSVTWVDEIPRTRTGKKRRPALIGLVGTSE